MVHIAAIALCILTEQTTDSEQNAYLFEELFPLFAATFGVALAAFVITLAAL